jgi:hypothetical protein
MHEIRSLIAQGGQREIVVKKDGRADQRKAGGLSGIPITREESRKTNQRREDRHLNAIDRAVIRFRRKNIEVAVMNASSYGVMIDADIEPRIGERMTIRFEDCNPTDCHVRWVKGSRIGLEFASQTVLIAPADLHDLLISGRRVGEVAPKVELKPERAPRHNLLWKAVLHFGIESMVVRLRNISTRGAMIDSAEDLLVGTEVVLEFAGARGHAAAGKVRWCKCKQVGMSFDAPFDMRILAEAEPSDDVVSVVPRYVMPDYLTMEDEDSPWAARTYGLRPEDL